MAKLRKRFAIEASTKEGLTKLTEEIEEETGLKISISSVFQLFEIPKDTEEAKKAQVNVTLEEEEIEKLDEFATATRRDKQSAYEYLAVDLIERFNNPKTKAKILKKI